MKNKIIIMSFICSVMFGPFLNGSQTKNDVKGVSVFRIPDPEMGNKLCEADEKDAKLAQAKLKEAVDSGQVSFDPKDTVILVINPATKETRVGIDRDTGKQVKIIELN